MAYVASGDSARAEAWISAHLEGVRKGIEALTLDGAALMAPGDGVEDEAAQPVTVDG